MRMVSEKDLNSCWVGDHDDIEESDDGDDGQRRGANQRRSDVICQTIGLLRHCYASSRNSRSAFIEEALRRTSVTRVTGKAVTIHISSIMARELIATNQTMYHLWCLEYQRVLPQLRLHLPRHHLHHRGQHRKTGIQCRKTEMWKCQKEVEVRMKSFGETCCMIPQKPKTKTKTRNRKRYKETYRMNCLIGHRNSGRIWLMKVLQKSFGETWCRGVHTLPVRLMNLQWSREYTWNRVRVSTVYLRTFPRIRIVKSAWRPK